LHHPVIMGARASTYRRRRPRDIGKAGWQGSVKVTVFTAIIALACLVRFAEAPALVKVREAMATVVRTDTDYRGAVAVVGRAVTGEAQGEDSVLVFGRKLLGLEEAAVATEEAPSEQGPGGETPPQQEDSAGTSVEEEAGASSGFSPAAPDYAEEAVLPVFVPSPVLLGGSLLWDEMDDNTPDEAFLIPSPDIVDDTVYALPFACAAPARGRVSSGFGYRVHPISGETTFHHGADLAAGVGTRVNAFAAGTVAEVGNHSVYGLYVKLDHGDGFVTLYAHLDTAGVKKGEKVKLGEKIAASGNSGYSTGAHLHFELRRDGLILDPFRYVSFE